MTEERKIVFDGDYEKLHGQVRARLVHVQVLDTIKMSKDLIEYDTRRTDGSYYSLPNDDKLLHLTFVGNKRIPFCTLRTHNPEKEKRYRELLGKTFEIEISSGGKQDGQ